MTLTRTQVGVSRLYKERCFCVGYADERGCGCPEHVQLAYLLKALQLWRKAEHAKCKCTCKTCRDSHRLGRGQITDCSSFGTAIHRGEFCGKDAERGCRPLRCALGECEDCQHYDDALHVCPEEYSSKRLVRYKTSEPVSSAGKVFEDWVYRECAIRPFLKLLRDFYLQKYRFEVHPSYRHTLTHSLASILHLQIT